MIMVMMLDDDKDDLEKQLVARLQKVGLDEWRTTLDQTKNVNFLKREIDHDHNFKIIIMMIILFDDHYNHSI